MSGLNPEITYHTLDLRDDIPYVVQRRQKHSSKKAEDTKKVIDEILKARFITEAWYTTWISNILIVRKVNKKWSICVNYLDLNRTCPKYYYPHPYIDKLIKISYEFKLLSFMDAYSRNYHIPFDNFDRSKTNFMTNE